MNSGIILDRGCENKNESQIQSTHVTGKYLFYQIYKHTLIKLELCPFNVAFPLLIFIFSFSFQMSGEITVFQQITTG